MVNHDVRLVVGGRSFERCWTNFEVDQDVRKWPFSWRFTAQPVGLSQVAELRNACATAQVVSVAVDGTTVATGRTVDIESGIDRSKGTFVNVSGAGPLASACKASMPLGHSVGGMTILDAVTSALEPWGIEVIASNAANRSATTTRTISETSYDGGATWARAHGGQSEHQVQSAAEGTTRTRTVPDDRKVVARPGETVADWIRRFLAQNNLLMWETARGQVFVGLPRYDLPPLFTIIVPESPSTTTPVEGQVVDCRLTDRPGDQATSYTVTGRVGRGGATRVSSTATDEWLVSGGWHCPKITSDDAMRDNEKAERKAWQLLNADQLECWQYEVTLAGHGVGRFLPAIDTMVNVRDPICEINETLWCAGRKFAYSRDNGATVTLTLVRPDLWRPESE